MINIAISFGSQINCKKSGNPRTRSFCRKKPSKSNRLKTSCRTKRPKFLSRKSHRNLEFRRRRRPFLASSSSGPVPHSVSLYERSRGECCRGGEGRRPRLPVTRRVVRCSISWSSSRAFSFAGVRPSL